MEKLHQSNILDSFGLKGVYLTVGEAVADISSSWKAQPWIPKMNFKYKREKDEASNFFQKLF